eukprot:1925021-Pyramimonas_sp.AAC.1
MGGYRACARCRAYAKEVKCKHRSLGRTCEALSGNALRLRTPKIENIRQGRGHKTGRRPGGARCSVAATLEGFAFAFSSRAVQQEWPPSARASTADGARSERRAGDAVKSEARILPR